MENKIVFGKWEATALMINLICTQVFLNFPRAMIEVAGQGGWIVIVYVSILALLGFALISKLFSCFEGKDLLDISEYMGGAIGRIVVGLIITLFFLSVVSLILREFVEDMKVISLTVSPVSFVTLFFIAGMVVGTYFGLEAIVRFGAIAVPVIAAGYIFIIVGVASYYDFTNLTPILGTGLYNIFVSGFPKLSTYVGLLSLLLIAPFVKTHKNFKSIGFSAIGISAFFLITSTVVYLAVVEYPSSRELFLPIYQLARLINYGRFFQRVESVFVLLWATTALLYLSSGLFFLVYVFKKTFKLEYYRPLIIPFTIIIFSLSLLPPNLVAAVKLDTDLYRNISWTITFVLPVFVALIARLRRRTKKEGVQNEK